MFLQFLRTMTIFRLAFMFWLDYLRIRLATRTRRREDREVALSRAYARAGIRFRRAAFRLQGLIVKVGQFLSARTDVLPLSFTRELSQLQDAVPAAPFERVRPVLEAELGAPLPSVFSEFDHNAIAAASLGQVYRAKLMGGEVVAVKVVRPGIERLAQTDLRALRRIVRILHRFTKFGRRMNLIEVYTEFAAMVRQELDYRMEAEHLKRFARQFSTNRQVVVPRLHETFVSRRLLVMEFLEGAKITDLERIRNMNVDPDTVLRTLLDAFLRQVLLHGFVHVDPHPGNLLVLPDGRLGIIDFGMMTDISPDEMQDLSNLIKSAVTRDLDTLVGSVDRLGFLQPHADRAFLKKALGYMLDRLNGIQLKKGRDLDEFLEEFQDFLHDEPVIVQAKYMFLGRAIGLLAGTVNSLSPSFAWGPFLRTTALPLVGQFAAGEKGKDSGFRRTIGDVVSAIFGDSSGVAVDFALKQAEDIGKTLIRIPGELERVLDKAESGELTIRLHLDEVLKRLDRQERRMSMAFWLGASIGFAVLAAWLHANTHSAWMPHATDGTLGAGALCLLVVLIKLLRWPSHDKRLKSSQRSRRHR